jgi:hypothetical protein
MDSKGLYRKALAKRGMVPAEKKMPDKNEDNTLPGGQLHNANYDEEAELNKIDALLAANRLEVNPETFRVKPQKQGSFFPLLLNIASFFLIIIGSVVLIVIYNQNEQSITSELNNYQSNEGSLLEAVKEELNQKKAQISDIEQKMQAVQQEKEKLKMEMQGRISSKEQELEAALKKELANERERLIQQGLAAQVIEQMLQTTETQGESQKQQQLESYKAQLAVETQKKEADFSLAIDVYRQKLQSTIQAQIQLTDELNKNIEEQKKLQAQEQTLRSERSRMADELTKMQELQQKESLLIDQINSYYQQVNINVNAGRYSAANEALTGLEALFSASTVNSSPAVLQRKETDLSIIQIIKKYLTSENSQPEKETIAALRQKLVLKIAEAEKYFQQKDYRKAFDNYIIALDYWELDSATLTLLQTRFQNVGFILSEAEQQSKEAALAMSQIQYEEKARQTLIIQIDQFKQEFARSIRTKQKTTQTTEQMVALLDAKVLVRNIISAEPVRSQYPDLYLQLERYFKALSEEQRQEGQRLLLADLINFMENCRNKKSLATIKESWAAAYTQTSHELLLRFLERLQTLLH